MTIQHSIQPFNHWIIDNFLDANLAKQLATDFLPYDDPSWYEYKNPLENKKTLNNWWYFPPTTYYFLRFLNSSKFISYLEQITGIETLYPDPGLHGAGWHIHGNGGKLNIHLDYSLHPKLNLERKLNLILYLPEHWEYCYGGHLEFWSGNKTEAFYCEKIIDCVFNRAVIFDTTQNSWHGFPKSVICPEGIFRKSIAMYYLVSPGNTVDYNRKRAHYAPTEEQKNNSEIEAFIEQRKKFND